MILGINAPEIMLLRIYIYIYTPRERGREREKAEKNKKEIRKRERLNRYKVERKCELKLSHFVCQ